MTPDAERTLVRRQGVVLAVTAVAVVATGTAGWVLTHQHDVRLHLLGGYLIRGPFAVDLTPWVVLPVALGAAVVTMGHRVAATTRWRPLLAVTWLATVAWAVTLAWSRWGPTTPEGSSALGAPLEVRYEYLHDIPRVDGLPSLLRDYVSHIGPGAADPWTTHVAGHPPGPLAFFAGLEAIGLGGSLVAGLACVLAGAAAVPAVLVAVRRLHDEDAARTLAPFLVVAPGALWVATSADALWTGTSAWALALLTLAGPGTRGRLAALGSGLLFGLSVFGSYGVAPLALPALVVLWRRGRLGSTGWVATGVLLPVAAAGAMGFWWWEGLLQTAKRVAAGPGAMDRPLAYFLVANLAVAVLALGPAVVAALGSGRPGRRLRDLPLVWSFGLALLVTDLTGLAKGEVERIWLPYFPWLTVAVLLLPRRHHRAWLVVQVAAALAIQVFVRTEW